MFVVYSKQTGKIVNIAVGGSYEAIKDLYPYDYQDYELIYDCFNTEDNLKIINNQDFFKVENDTIVFNQEHLNFLKGGD